VVSDEQLAGHSGYTLLDHWRLFLLCRSVVSLEQPAITEYLHAPTET